MLALLMALADITTSSDMTWWQQWLQPSTLDRMVQLGGLTLLAILFARGSIITKGQHDARIADLVKYADAEKLASDESHKRELQQMASHHLELMSEKDRRFDGMKESRDAWRETSQTQTARADQATAQLMEMNELAGLAVQQLKGLEDAAAAASAARRAEVSS